MKFDRFTFALQAVVAAAALVAGAAHAGGATLAPIGTKASLADTTDQLVVSYHAGASELQSAAVSTVLSQYGVDIAGTQGDKVRLTHRISHDKADKLAAALKTANPNIADAYPDRWATVQFTPNDPLFKKQWHYFEKVGGIRLKAAWDRSTGAGVTVAVIDTGYRPHADLAANLVPGYDMIVNTAVSNDGDGRDADASDPGDGCGGQSSWHGTHVAGTIAAVSNNGVGVAGIAYNAKVQPVRVLGCGGGYFSDVQDGIIWASGGTVAGVPANPTPSRVINMSLSGSSSTCPAALQAAIDGAVSRGTVVVVAAGNSGGNAQNATPANCNNVITVAATNRLGSKAWYSNFGATVEIAAPGGDTSILADGVLSTLNAGVSTPGADNYAYYQGTSMASPHVAGVAALILSLHPTWTPAQVLARIQSTARPFPGTCVTCGSGIVNAAKAAR